MSIMMFQLQFGKDHLCQCPADKSCSIVAFKKCRCKVRYQPPISAWLQSADKISQPAGAANTDLQTAPTESELTGCISVVLHHY